MMVTLFLYPRLAYSFLDDVMMRTCDKDDCQEPVKWSLIFRLGDPNFDFCEQHYAEARKVLSLWCTGKVKVE